MRLREGFDHKSEAGEPLKLEDLAEVSKLWGKFVVGTREVHSSRNCAIWSGFCAVLHYSDPLNLGLRKVSINRFWLYIRVVVSYIAYAV